MKKNYFLTVLFAFAMMTTVNAQFTDDMESYTVGTQVFGAHWSDWGGTGSNALWSSADQAHSGAQSGHVPGGVNPDDGTNVDAVLDLGNKIFGTWGLEFYMYVPTGNVGYYNLQGTIPIGGGDWIVGNVNFGDVNPGEGSIDDTVLGAVDFTFPHDEWFSIIMNFDISAGMSAATWEMAVDGTIVIPAGTAFTHSDGSTAASLGGLDIYSNGPTFDFYVDDFTYQDSFIVILGTQDLNAKGFSAYPNPVTNVLNLNAKEAISSVSVYNVLGQEVYSANVNALNTTIDTASFTSGVYFVKVNIAGTEGTVKILK